MKLHIHKTVKWFFVVSRSKLSKYSTLIKESCQLPATQSHKKNVLQVTKTDGAVIL